MKQIKDKNNVTLAFILLVISFFSFVSCSTDSNNFDDQQKKQVLEAGKSTSLEQEWAQFISEEWKVVTMRNKAMAQGCSGSKAECKKMESQAKILTSQQMFTPELAEKVLGIDAALFSTEKGYKANILVRLKDDSGAEFVVQGVVQSISDSFIQQSFLEKEVRMQLFYMDQDGQRQDEVTGNSLVAYLACSNSCKNLRVRLVSEVIDELNDKKRYYVSYYMSPDAEDNAGYLIVKMSTSSVNTDKLKTMASSYAFEKLEHNRAYLEVEGSLKNILAVEAYLDPLDLLGRNRVTQNPTLKSFVKIGVKVLMKESDCKSKEVRGVFDLPWIDGIYGSTSVVKLQTRDGKEVDGLSGQVSCINNCKELAVRIFEVKKGYTRSSTQLLNLKEGKKYILDKTNSLGLMDNFANAILAKEKLNCSESLETISNESFTEPVITKKPQDI